MKEVRRVWKRAFWVGWGLGRCLEPAMRSADIFGVTESNESGGSKNSETSSSYFGGWIHVSCIAVRTQDYGLAVHLTKKR